VDGHVRGPRGERLTPDSASSSIASTRKLHALAMINARFRVVT
jgi:hypothetical protein